MSPSSCSIAALNLYNEIHGSLVDVYDTIINTLPVDSESEGLDSGQAAFSISVRDEFDALAYQMLDCHEAARYSIGLQDDQRLTEEEQRWLPRAIALRKSAVTNETLLTYLHPSVLKLCKLLVTRVEKSAGLHASLLPGTMSVPWTKLERTTISNLSTVLDSVEMLNGSVKDLTREDSIKPSEAVKFAIDDYLHNLWVSGSKGEVDPNCLLPCGGAGQL